MTFPKRGTRQLRVAGRRFVWHVSPPSVDGGGARYTFAASRNAGRALCVWPESDFPSPEEAARWIAFALGAGWDPSAKGPTLWIDRRSDPAQLTETPIRPAWEQDRRSVAREQLAWFGRCLADDAVVRARFGIPLELWNTWATVARSVALPELGLPTTVVASARALDDALQAQASRHGRDSLEQLVARESWEAVREASRRMIAALNTE